MANLIWREPKVKETTGLSKSTRWRMEKAGDFPQKVQLSPRAVGWRAEEIIQWCKERCEAKNVPIGKHKGEAGSVDPEARREAGESSKQAKEKKTSPAGAIDQGATPASQK